VKSTDYQPVNHYMSEVRTDRR